VKYLGKLLISKLKERSKLERGSTGRKQKGEPQYSPRNNLLRENKLFLPRSVTRWLEENLEGRAERKGKSAS